MQEISKKPIAVLGGGAGGKTLAADIALAGREVRLYELPEFKEGVKKVIETGKIEIKGEEANAKNFKRNGIAEIDVVTTDIEEALEGVGLINIAIPAIGQEKFFEKMLPHLKDGHVVGIFPDNYGSLLLKRKLIEENIDERVIIGGWSSLPYATRQRGMKPGKINLANRAIELRGDTLPSKDWKDFRRVMKEFPPLDPTDIEKGDTVLDIGLSNPNPPVHVPGSIMNVGQMENYGDPEEIYGDEEGDYSLYVHGTSPSVGKMMAEFYEEECRVADAIGVDIASWDKEDFLSKSNIMFKHYMGRDAKVPYKDREWNWTVGPQTVKDRYFTEDIPVGAHVCYELAQKFNVDVPTIESCIILGSKICEQNFMEEGRSLKDLGIADMSRNEMLEYLREGK